MQQKDSNLTNAIRKLSELAGLQEDSGAAASLGNGLETSPAIKKLREDLDSLTKTVQKQGQDITGIHGSVMQTRDDIGDIKYYFLFWRRFPGKNSSNVIASRF